MTYKDAYQDNHVSFEITDIVWEDDYVNSIGAGERPEVDISDLAIPPTAGIDRQEIQTSRLAERKEYDELVENISFEYEAPAIAVDTAGRFITHEIIGGSTVRQKVGEDPIEVTIDGVCKESTAKRLDNLRNAKYGTILSNRLSEESLRVQFASTSTTPLEDSGAVALTDNGGEFLYTYTLNCVEVVV